MGSKFKQRLIMSLLSITFLAFAISYAHHPYFIPFFIIGNALIIGMALAEFYQLAKNKGYQPLTTPAILCSTLYLVTTYVGMKLPGLQSYSFLILLASLLIFFLLFFNRLQNSIVNLSITTFGLIYLTLPLTCILQIIYFESSSDLDHGRLWLTYVLVVTKITDMGAYFAGKTLGKNKLAMHISPKKTIEGALGGTILSLCASLAFYHYFFASAGLMTLPQSLFLGLSISILAQLGDLAESVLKRDADVKDSSHLPGFGGILDVVDSLVFTLPFMYLLLQMRLIG